MSDRDLHDSVNGDTEFRETDLIYPQRIDHFCEEIFSRGSLEEKYNYLIYTFDAAGEIYTAKHYLGHREVSIWTPEENLPPGPSTPEIYERVLSYLRRRYFVIDRFNRESGSYLTVWQWTPAEKAGIDQSAS